MAKVLDTDPLVKVKFTGPYVHVSASWKCAGCNHHMQLHHQYANGLYCAHQWIAKVKPYKFGWSIKLLYKDSDEKLMAVEAHPCSNKGFKGTVKPVAPVSFSTTDSVILEVTHQKVMDPWKHYIQEEAKPLTEENLKTALETVKAAAHLPTPTPYSTWLKKQKEAVPQSAPATEENIIAALHKIANTTPTSKNIQKYGIYDKKNMTWLFQGVYYSLNAVKGLAMAENKAKGWNNVV